ncbi:MAG: TIGR02611 family protein [Pseudonocardiaceae bacterium]|nr:TIGR02611 family protein [Pseudonocardiaceae bacterium]
MSSTVDDERAGRPGASRLPWPHHRSRLRQRLGRRPGVDLAYRIVVGVVGGMVLAAGIVMIPYPGPGWLVVFAGLAILGSEFTWAHRLLHTARERYDEWTAWMRRQPAALRLAMMALTGLVVVLTLWLVNAFGLVATVIGLDWSWLQGPIG